MMLVAAACGVSLVLLMAVLLLGPADHSATGGGDASQGSSASAARPLADIDLPTAVPNQPGEFEAQVGQLVEGEAVFLQQGRRTVLKYARLEPEADGVLRVDKPRARIIFSPTRVLEVASDTGVLIAPEGQLLEGTFTGNVVTTFYQSKPGQPLDLADLTQIQMRLFLNDAVYDEQLGRLRSDGPVFMTSQSLDATGQGLTLTFNPLRQRLERMIIREGDRIRFNPRAPGQAQSMANAPATPPAATAGDDSSPTPDLTPDPTPPQDEPVQYYQANFLEDINVNVAFGQQILTGDRLSVSFAIEPGNVETTASRRNPDEHPGLARIARVQPPSPPPASIRPASNPIIPADDRLQPWDKRSLMTRSLGDVVVKWKGQLQVNPLESAPPGFAGPSDALIGLAGTPMRIRTALNELVEASQGNYLLSTGRLRAVSSAKHGLLLDSPRLGILTGRAMQIVLSEATGWVRGPGSLRAATTNRGEPGATYDLMASWNGQLDLEFLTEVNEAAATADRDDDALDWIQPTQLTGIRVAQFNQDVDVKHPRFTTKAQALRLTLEPVAGNDPWLQQIDAKGDVQMASLSDQPDQKININAQNLQLKMAEPGEDGDQTPRPQLLLAEGEVHAWRPDYALKADHLFTRFAPGGEGQDFELTTLLANGNVNVTALEQQARLQGQRLSANTAERRIELKSEDQQARVIRDNGVITAGHFIFDEQRASFQAIGPGRADLKALRENGPATDVIVNWTKSMSYDDKTELLSFLGDVDAQTINPGDTTKLTSDQLDLTFARLGQANANDPDNPLGDRQLKTAVAVGHVQFQAESIDPQQDDKLETRLRLEGPKVTVNNETATVTVTGAGDMLIEDYRPADAAQAGAPKAIALTGRGATLFKWTDSLTLDGGKSDMTMLGQVQMVHAPEGQPDQRLRMTCQRLEADMVNAGGIRRFGDELEQDADPDFKSLFATGDVTLRTGNRRVNTQYLRYTDDNQTVELWSDPPRLSQVSQDDQASALTAEKIKWDLGRDRFEAIRMGSGGFPAGR